MAWLLTGEWPGADDLVQTALTRTWQRWNTHGQPDDPEAYVRRVIFTTFLRWRRRKWTGELALGWQPDRPIGPDIAAEVAGRSSLIAALLDLPRQQRAVVVLRFFNDLSERSTAEVLGCSVGSVKTHTSRALQALRANPAIATKTAWGQP